MSKKKLVLSLLSAFAVFNLQYTFASINVPIHLVGPTTPGQNIGVITLEDSFSGVLVTPNLHDLPTGVHGFHIHVNPNCNNQGLAAGGHLDPSQSDQHHGPYKKHGHLGDLPVLIVDKDGKATLPTLAPRFTLKEIIGHSIMIHAGGDNYSDQPEKLGGGGARIACGIIKST